MIPIIEFDEIIRWLKSLGNQVRIETLGRRSFILVRYANIKNVDVIEITGSNNIVFNADKDFWKLLTSRMLVLNERERAMGSRYVEPYFNGARGNRFRPSIPAICRFYGENLT